MRVLLTGHQGYLGTVMAPVLRRGRARGVGLDTGLFADCVLGPLDPPDPPGLRRRPARRDGRAAGRVRRRGPPGRAVQRPARRRWRRSSPTTSTTTRPTRLARLARDAGVARFLYASTCSVYGAQSRRRPGRRGRPAAAGDAVRRVEGAGRGRPAELADADFTPVFLRNATAFGFSPRLRADIVLNNLVGHALLSGKVLVLSDGTPWRPLVHADDIARAVRRRAGRAARWPCTPGVQRRHRDATTSPSPRSPRRSSRRCRVPSC